MLSYYSPGEKMHVRIIENDILELTKKIFETYFIYFIKNLQSFYSYITVFV